MNASNRQATARRISTEMAQYRVLRRRGERGAAWQALERAHIVAQPHLVPHLASHWHMLGFALALRDGREAAGQVLRLVLVPLGALTGKLPIGNTGRARVSAFRPMPVPSDLAPLISPSDKEERRW